MKIYKVRGCDKLSKWDLEKLKNLDADLFIYNYQNWGYEGSGFALWRNGKKYGYTYLGHCSCNGPLDDLKSILYTITAIKKLTKENNYEWKFAPSVLNRLKEIQAKEKTQ